MFNIHPLELARILWPTYIFYDKQREIVESVWRNKETYVPAGNKLGKDYIAARIIILFFLTRHPCRVVTTSAKEDHLDVLWGEMGQAILDSAHPLDHRKGGPLKINSMEIRRIINGVECPLSYIKGLVASADRIAAMQGHHVANPGDDMPRTMFVCDESSSVPDDYYTKASTWFDRALVFGNTWPCENFFRRHADIEKGARDVPSPFNDGTFVRKIIRITAKDSPNVRLAMAQIRSGKKPTGERLVAGVKGYREYLEDLTVWDAHQICVSHDARWYEGSELKLFPPNWRQAAVSKWHATRGHDKGSTYMGVDPGEGMANTTWSIGDDVRMRKMVSMKTPDTDHVPHITLDLMQQYNMQPENACMDRGGGGKQHADRINAILEKRGIYQRIRTVAFGEALALLPRRGLRLIEEKIGHREEHYAYRNRRCQMYAEASALIDPLQGGYGIPPEELGEAYQRLHHALSVIPRMYDGEGRLDLPPKHRRAGEETKKKTLTEMVGGDAKGLDEADAFVLMCHAKMHQSKRAVAGVVR